MNHSILNLTIENIPEDNLRRRKDAYILVIYQKKSILLTVFSYALSISLNTIKMKEGIIFGTERKTFVKTDAE